jgi:hypothetical protein
MYEVTWTVWCSVGSHRGAAPRLRASADSRLARRRFAHNEFDLEPRPPTTTPRLTQQVLPTPPTCVPTKTPSAAKRSTRARCVLPSPQGPPHVPDPPSRQTRTAWPRDTPAGPLGTDADGLRRASCTSVVTARSSASRTARPSPCSSSARTPARSHGRLCTDGCTRRVSLRLVHPTRAHGWTDADEACGL